MQDKLIISDPAILLGRPVVAGTRVTVDEILDRLADGATANQIVANHPGLTPAGVLAALRFGAEAVRATTPVEKHPPLELHGPHIVSVPDATTGSVQPAVAVRAFVPEAAEVSVRRMIAMSSGEPDERPAAEAPVPASSVDAPPLWTDQPMERIHPGGVFEALFPGETEPFRYQLAVTQLDGKAYVAEDPYSLDSFITAEDLKCFKDLADPAGPTVPGEHIRRLHEKLGAHLVEHAGLSGVAFTVWAPHAESVSVIGDFNLWNELCHPMRPLGATGLWDLFIPGLEQGERYKYRIKPQNGGPELDKADPYGFAAELRPQSASVVWDLRRYRWHDDTWLAGRAQRQTLSAPLAIYEVHLGSWRRASAGEANGEPRWLTYRELAEQLVPYVKGMGYTHIEPMPVAEHPFDGSWGYQITGFFAPTSRYGTPDDFRYFVDAAHQAGLGVILDWVPGHFPKDAHGLTLFDGSHLYEHADPRRSENLEWGTSAFNLERAEVRAFLLSNALFWLDQYHVDGLRVDAVSSMIYLDYSRRHWVPNQYGGRENLEAAMFLQHVNALVHHEHPGVLTFAEESTAWPRVTGPDIAGSLGFDLKWNLGWMHDTTGYLARDPIHRRHHHTNLTFSLVYAFSENFLLPLSHDEVVHGKRSLLSKMPGDEWQRFANLRALYGYMYAHPGKKLQFMGGEFGQRIEWNHDKELDWSLLERPRHRQLQTFIRDLNRLYVAQPALHEVDFSWDGFQWIDCNDAERSIVSFIRRSRNGAGFLVAVANFTPVPREGYRLGVPAAGRYRELLNSDDTAYGGSGVGNRDPVSAETVPIHGQPCSVVIALPPLAIVILAAVEPQASGHGSQRGRLRRKHGGQSSAK